MADGFGYGEGNNLVDLFELMTGGLDPFALPPLPTREVKTYICSTGHDMLAEQRILFLCVYSKLREFCRRRFGFDFHAVDLRWGMTSSDDVTDQSIRMELIRECQRESFGPSFVALLGQMYGGFSLPQRIPCDEYEGVRTALTHHKGRETRDVNLLDDFYALDLNSVEPQYVLNVTALQKLEAASKENTEEGGACPVNKWWVEQRLRELLQLGAEISLRRGEPVNLSPNSSKLVSVFELELHQGLQFGPPESGQPPASSRCILFNRTIVDLKNFAGHPAAPRYTEVTCERGKFKVEIYSQLCLSQLRGESVRELGPENVLEESVLFREDEGVSPTLHLDYLRRFSRSIFQKLQSLIEASLCYPMPSLTRPLYKEVYQHWQLAALRSEDIQASVLSRSATLDVVKSYVLSNDSKPLVVCGRAGSGRTTIISQAAVQIHRWVDGPMVRILRQVGVTSLSRDLRHLLSSICCQLHNILTEESARGQSTPDIPQNYDGLVIQFHHLLANFPDNQSLVLLLDDLDLLDPDLYEPFTFHWLPPCLKENVKVIFSVRTATPIFELLKKNVIESSKNFLEVPVVEREPAEKLLEWYLKERGRCLTKEQASKISERCFQNECKPVVPLYVRLISEMVSPWTSDDPADRADCLPQDLPAAVKAYLEDLEKSCGRALVSRALSLLTLSPPGLSDTEMEDLLNVMATILPSEVGDHVTSSDCVAHVSRVAPMGWIRLRSLLGGYLTRLECEGAVVRYWTHQIFVEGVKSRYIEPINGWESKLHSVLASYWLGNHCCNSNSCNNCNNNTDNNSSSSISKCRSDNTDNDINMFFGISASKNKSCRPPEGSNKRSNIDGDKRINNNNSNSCRTESRTSVNGHTVTSSKSTDSVSIEGDIEEWSGNEYEMLPLSHWQPLRFNEAEGECARPLYNLRKIDQLTRHLYLSGRQQELEQATLLSYSWIEHRIHTFSLYTLLDDYRYSPSPEVHLVYRALRDADQLILADPSCLPVELAGRLMPYYDTARLAGLRQLVVEADSASAVRCGLVPGFPYRQVPAGPHRNYIRCKEIPVESYGYGPDDDELLVKDPDSPLVHNIDLLSGIADRSVTMSRGKLYISPTRRYAVISDYEKDKTLKIHRVRDGGFLGYLTPLDKVDIHAREKHRVHDLCLSDEKICFLLSTVDNSFLCVASLISTSITQVFSLAGKATACVMTPDGCHVAVGVGERLLIYPLQGEEGGCVGEIILGGSAHIIKFSPDSCRAVISEYCTSILHTLHLSCGDVTSHNTLDLSGVHMNQHDMIHGLNFSHSQSLCLARLGSGLIVLDLCTQRSLLYIPRPCEVPVRFRLPHSCEYTEDIQFTEALFTPDDCYIVASIFRSVYVWAIHPEATERQSLVARLVAPIGLITSLHLTSAKSSSCHIAVTCHQSSVVTVWSLENTVDVVNSLDRMTSPVTSLKFSADDRKIFASCNDSDEVGIVDMQSGRLEDLFAHEGAVQSTSVSPSGRLLFVALRTSRSEMYNKIWDVPNRRVLQEFGNAPAFSVSYGQSDTSTQPSQSNSSVHVATSSVEEYHEYFWAVCQSSPVSGCPYDLIKFRASFDAPTATSLTRVECLSGAVTCVLESPLLTADSRYMVLLGVSQELPSPCPSCFHCHAQPAICAVDLQHPGDACSGKAPVVRWFGTDYLRDSLPSLKRILAVRPYPKNEFAVVVLYTNEPGCWGHGESMGGTKPADTKQVGGATSGTGHEGGAKPAGCGENGCFVGRYDHNFGFLIWDVCSGVAFQVIDDLIPPRTPLNHLLFPDDLRFFVDDLSNIFELAAGKCLGNVVRGGAACGGPRFSLTDVAPGAAGTRTPGRPGQDCCREEEEVRPSPPQVLVLVGHAVVYAEGVFLSVWRVSDGARLGRVCVHACISTIKVAHDGRTLLIGCEDGSILSYVFTDPSLEDSSQVLSCIPSRHYPSWACRSSGPRVWDQVTPELQADCEGASAPEYSKPPSISCYPDGRSDWSILHDVARNNNNNSNGWNEDVKNKIHNIRAVNESGKAQPPARNNCEINSCEKRATEKVKYESKNSENNANRNGNCVHEAIDRKGKLVNGADGGKVCANNRLERSKSVTCAVM